jgi:hypothetical protein
VKDKGHRQHIFEAGKRYRVLVECEFRRDKVYQFRAGEVLVFCQDYYSPYDSEFSYAFRTESGEELYWCLHDTEADDKWRTYFQRVDNQAP